MADQTPPSQSEIRSQAVARLKRAASLPRRQPGGGDGSQPSSWSQSRSRSPPRVITQGHDVVAYPHYGEYEETLTPQRATYNIDTSIGQYASPYTPHDLTAYNTVQSRSTTSSAHPTPSPSPTPSLVLGIGRSTPSPLPSLGELRQLHRANSAAGRLVAMKKLMGENPPSPTALQRAGSVGSTGMLATQSTPGQTSDFGIGSPSRRRGAPPRTADDSDPSARLLQADENRVNARPRLERSYTVGNGGGEERRSVIGRRMMQRLGNRVAIGRLGDEVLPVPVRKTEAAPVESKAMQHATERQPPGRRPDTFGANEVFLGPPVSTDEPITPLDSQRFHSIIQDDSPTDPSPIRTANYDRLRTPTKDTSPPSATLAPLDYMHPPGRAPSRTSAVSGDDAFEYEVHLRRSLSEKERKGKLQMQTTPEKEKAGSRLHEDLQEERLVSPLVRNEEMLPESGLAPRSNAETPVPDDYISEENDDFLPPRAPFVSAASHSPIPLGHTPASPESSMASTKSSSDPMARIPFMLAGDTRPPRVGPRMRTGREESMASFPAEVGDGDEGRASSGFGTPGRDVESIGDSTPSDGGDMIHQQTLATPALLPAMVAGRSPPATSSGSAFKEHFDDESEDDDERTESTHHAPAVVLPNRTERSDSTGSWDVVGGPADQEVIVDPRSRRTEGMVGQLHRSLSRTFSRRKAKDVSPVGTASLTPSIQNTRTSRAGSQGSGSGESAGQQQMEPASSLGPSSYNDPTKWSDARKGSLGSSILSAAPSIVLEPGRNSPMPQADLSDPRFHHPKLFPAPGVLPPMLQQATDSVVPTLQSLQASSADSLNIAPSSASQHPPSSATYYELSSRPTSPTSAPASVGKKSWLAEAFFAPTGLHKKKPSISEMMRRKPSHSGPIVDFSHPMPAPYPPRGSNFERKEEQALPRSNSAPLSVEKGQLPVSPPLSHASATAPPPSPPAKGLPATPVLGMSQKTQQVIQRLDNVLALSPDDTDRPDVLDDPPRRLVLCSPMLQVVNGHTVKDRFLFLFTDILVLAKPLSDDSRRPLLDGLFAVKSIVTLDSLTLSGSTADEKHAAESHNRHPVVVQFIDLFAKNPEDAIKLLYERSQLQGDSATLASLLFKTPELDKERLGEYLARRDRQPLLRAFVDRFHFQGVRIDEALRMFLLSIRLPSATMACEALLYALAERWRAANRATVSFDTALAGELVLAIMQLNDAVNPGSGFGSFAFANPAISIDDFVGAFRTKDIKASVPTDLLEAIYTSIRRESLAQSLSTSEASSLREVIVTPARLPTRLTHNQWSERIYVSIPKPDSRFGVRLHGEGLAFDPPYLDFTSSTEESFRVMGTSLGARSLLMSRVGANAPLYSNLANAKTFVVERSFMQHTFQLAFVNHLGVKRKYCFSLEDAESRDTWFTALSTNIQHTRAEMASLATGGGLMTPRLRSSARSITLKVLQDALIAEDREKDEVVKPAPTSAWGNNKTYSPPPSLKKPKIVRQISGRRVSVAKIMQVSMPTEPGLSIAEEPEPEIPAKTQKGKDIVLICRQNSILTIVLGLLNAAMDGTPAGEVAADQGLGFTAAS